MPQLMEAVGYLPQPVEVSKNNHLSFNLSHERERALDSMSTNNADNIKLARDGFIQNAQYWAKEYIGGIKTTHYLWQIVNNQGNTRLYHPSFGYADDASKNALEQDVPDYEKQRRKIEHQVTLQFSHVLQNAHRGDVFIWTSPPPEAEGVAGGVYGGYTMTHLYEVDEVVLNKGGNKKTVKVLKGRDVKNNLTNFSQKGLLEKLGGSEIFTDTPSSLDLLSTLVKVKFGTSTRDIEETIKRLEQYTGDTEEAKVREFEKILQDNELLLEQIFQMLILQDPNMSQAFIANYFRQYADKIAYSLKKALPKNIGGAPGWLSIAAVGGSCGAGVGFANAGFKSVFGYAPGAMASSLNGERTLKCNECPLCKTKDIDAIIKNGKIHCPSCKGSANYAC